MEVLRKLLEKGRPVRCRISPSGGPIDRIHGRVESIQYRREVLEIEPDRHTEGDQVHNDLYNRSPERLTAHAAEHFIIFTFKTINLIKPGFVWIHRRILSDQCIVLLRPRSSMDRTAPS